MIEFTDFRQLEERQKEELNKNPEKNTGDKERQ